jgi:hypothetical protein
MEMSLGISLDVLLQTSIPLSFAIQNLTQCNPDAISKPIFSLVHVDLKSFFSRRKWKVELNF